MDLFSTSALTIFLKKRIFLKKQLGCLPVNLSERILKSATNHRIGDSMTNRKNILLVEDEPPLAAICAGYLKDEPFDVVTVDLVKKAFDFLSTATPDAILLDLQLPDGNGMDVLDHVHEHNLPCTVIIVTANSSMKTAIEAMQKGAADFVMKPFNKDRLVYTLRHAFERQKLTTIVETYQKEFDRKSYNGFIGSSLAMQATYRMIDSAAPSTATLFITGESGTGKELCAEAAHQQSRRNQGPFIAINCGAIPRDLMESEIFGHVKGAYTGALSARDGAAQRADGGTLFLDEICEMHLDLQVKLLRFLQTGTFQKVGGSTSVKVDVRIVCATNRDPWMEVEAGRFREDLYYRLHVIPIHLPPLRDRDDDIGELAEHFLTRYASEEGKNFTKFSEEARRRLEQYSWPGNVRQMQNVIRNAVVMNDGDTISEAMLKASMTSAVRTQPITTAPAASNPSAIPEDISEDDRVVLFRDKSIRPMWEIERMAIKHAVDACNGNVQRAAAVLEISQSTAYRRLKEIKEGSVTLPKLPYED